MGRQNRWISRPEQEQITQDKHQGPQREQNSDRGPKELRYFSRCRALGMVRTILDQGIQAEL